MKAAYILILSLCLSYAIGQCTANAGGSSFVVCGIDSLILGGAPTANGGLGPYSYAWSMSYVPFSGSSVKFYASHFLDDTTLANPTVVNGILNDEKVWLYLKVTDANGCKARDSTLLLFSQYFTSLGHFSYSISQGDSLFLNHGKNVLGGVAPYSYLWRPNHGLKDSNSLSFWVKPERSTDYYLTVTDSLGCTITAPALYRIKVSTLSSLEYSKNLPVSLYPNPTHGIIRLQKDNLKIEKIEVFNAFDQKVKEINGNHHFIDLSIEPPGLYRVILKTTAGIGYKNIIKK